MKYIPAHGMLICLGLCALEQYESQTAPLKVTGTEALKREVMSTIDIMARKLEDIKQITN